ncbi:MAG: DUF362 domain-containing protein, partial [Candidatus Bathyarchaeia archaeon]
WRRKTEPVEAYERLAKQLGARFLDFNEYPFEEVAVKKPVFFDKVRVSKAILESDVFINVPTLKTHVQVGVTISFKNMFGVVPGLPGTGDKRFYHELDRVEEAILDLYKARRPDLIVVDGTYSTFHTGPRPIDDFKETMRRDLTIAGYDPVAVDVVGAQILGVAPRTIRYLKWAEKAGLGTGKPKNIRILGTPLEQLLGTRAPDTVDFANARMKNVRILNYGACTGCLKLTPQIQNFSALHRSMEKTVFIMGPEADLSKLREAVNEDARLVLCGNCAAPTYYNELQGEYIPGCPPTQEDAQRVLKKLSTPNREKGKG